MRRNLQDSGKPTGRPPADDDRRGTPARSVVPTHAPDMEIEDDGLADAVVLTGIDRRIHPADALTKGEVADYYRQVAPRLLPESAYRPLAVLRVPADHAPPTFQRSHHAALGGYVHPLAQGDAAHGFYIGGVTGLLQLVQAEAVEVHAGSATIRQQAAPDRLVLGLEAAASASATALAEAAHQVRARLRGAGLECFVRLSGDGGLRLVAPLSPGPGWAHLQTFASGFVAALVGSAPDRYAHAADTRRDDPRIVVQALATAADQVDICNWSLRLASDGVRVAMPLHWEQLDPHRPLAPVTPAMARHSAARLRTDPWSGISTLAQALPPR